MNGLMHRSEMPSFGHFVSAAKQRERNGNSERLAHPSLCLVNNANRETVT